MNKIQVFIVKVAGFINEVGLELKKSAWPTRAELQESTLVVIMSVIVLGIFVGLSDLILMRVLHLIL
ncbi:MAG: preprotein translocase subunit SecE [Kiritimatiellae bacterium]|nr:preprotein translocase subunit SecE [Kiritimatiellia bacterium]